MANTLEWSDSDDSDNELSLDRNLSASSSRKRKRKNKSDNIDRDATGGAEDPGEDETLDEKRIRLARNIINGIRSDIDRQRNDKDDDHTKNAQR